MHVPYKIFADGGRLPFATFILRSSRRYAMVEAFVDSGADFSIFHAGWIHYLKLDKKAGTTKRIQVGDGDYITAWLFNVEVDFYKHRFMAPLTFSDQLGPGFNLLGRQGFFNRFRFCFDDKHHLLTLTKL